MLSAGFTNVTVVPTQIARRCGAIAFCQTGVLRRPGSLRAAPQSDRGGGDGWRPGLVAL